jgi:MFS family permease
VLIGSQALHGVCYAFFFAASYIYVDRIAPADVRHSAQTIFGMLILGVGPVLGGWFSGVLEARGGEGAAVDYVSLWSDVSLIGLGAAALFALLFRDEGRRIPSFPRDTR